QTSASQVDRRRAAQTDIDRQLSEAQNKVAASRRNTAQITQKIFAVEKDVKTRRAMLLPSNARFNEETNEQEDEQYYRQRNQQNVMTRRN
ncbi:unnamed protein product, partial [Rotaria magnacalcarata]